MNKSLSLSPILLDYGLIVLNGDEPSMGGEGS